MGVRVEYEVVKLPDSMKFQAVHYAFEQDGDTKDKNGNLRKKMVQKVVEESGGYLIKVRGKPGHSIRVTTLEQAVALKLLGPDVDISKAVLEAKLINTETGEECDRHGVPLSVVAVVGENHGSRIDTDVDVERGDSTLEMDDADPAEAAVSGMIGKVE